MRPVVLIASTGRPEMLHGTLLSVLRQTLKPSRILVSTIKDEDVAPESRGLPDCKFFTGAKGLCAQLNKVINEIRADEDPVCVFDDDVELAPTFLETVCEAFDAQPVYIALGGAVVYDGAKRLDRIDREEAAKQIAGHTSQQRQTAESSRVEGLSNILYGCNMCFRREALIEERFDEELPLYSWLFEVDICRRLHRNGQVGNVPLAAVAHLASSGKKMSGVKMGYSQVCNPHYLWTRKRTMSFAEFCRHATQALASNGLRTLNFADPVDRLGRLKGNLLALWEISRGKSRPKRIEQL
jgi:hypothetical protein